MKKTKFYLTSFLLCIFLPSCSYSNISSTPSSAPPIASSSITQEVDLEPSIAQIPLSRYYGGIGTGTDTGRLIYDFQVTQDTIPVIQITFKKNLDNSTFQTLSYQLPEDFDPVTITDGVEVIDMNKDGIDDFLFDLGVYGKISKKVCLVYNNEAQQYIFIDDFEELNSPAFLKEYGYFVTAPIPMDLPMTYDRYLLDGTILHHVGRLSISQSESNTLYTEYEQVNGEWITTKDMVNENDVELTKWGLSSEQW
ncbi:hypothetical protein [uncultured Phocaeicola sp.]|uniref:hypothetical protein n=1 Tax=uncultured Phocaeicola sp. TaxID=990718 RepID=UPI00321FD9B4